MIAYVGLVMEDRDGGMDVVATSVLNSSFAIISVDDFHKSTRSGKSWCRGRLA